MCGRARYFVFVDYCWARTQSREDYIPTTYIRVQDGSIEPSSMPIEVLVPAYRTQLNQVKRNRTKGNLAVMKYTQVNKPCLIPKNATDGQYAN